jgi:energy coupling factor transporter S component ThiW
MSSEKEKTEAESKKDIKVKPEKGRKTTKEIPLTLKLALSVVFVAIGVVSSTVFTIPVPPIKAAPIQHTINILQAIMLGPTWAVLNAFIIGLLRNMLGLGTFFAFPGGMFGGLVVGILYWYVWKNDWVALTENIGTIFIGGTVGYLAVASLSGPTKLLGFISAGPPASALWGISGGLWVLWISFAVSCVPGSILGFITLKALRRAGLITT